MIRADILAESIDADDGRPAWSRDEFEAQLRENGKSYHIHHPFNVMLNTGHATPEQIRGWVANRYYYQIAIPVKDAAIMANCPDREVRRGWVQRILDHDHYGMEKIREMGLDLYGGCFNNRSIIGGKATSMHAWGIAVDIDPDRNGLNIPAPKAVLSGPEYAAFWQFVEAEGAVSLGRSRDYDWMHFQFATL